MRFKNKKPKYGPQTEEIEKILPKLLNPANRDVLYSIQVYSERPAIHVGYFETRAGIYASRFSLDTLPKQSGRAKAFDAAWYSTGDTELPSWVQLALGAVSIRDLVGSNISEPAYETLTINLVNFLSIVAATEPGTPKRELVCSLLLGGMDPQDAVKTANGALII